MQRALFGIMEVRTPCDFVGADAHIGPPFTESLPYVVRVDVGIDPYRRNTLCDKRKSPAAGRGSW